MSESDEKKYKYEKYLEERKLLIDAEREAARSFDKSAIYSYVFLNWSRSYEKTARY